MSSSCIIIYFDLVGYSKMNNHEQVQFFKQFQKELNYELYDEIVYENDKVALIPTGDGMIITIQDSITKRPEEITFNLVYSMFKWIREENMNFRCAIHNGNVVQVKDINQLKNVIGNSINDASRMLNGASDGDIVISDTFFKDYLKGNDSSWTKSKQYFLNGSSWSYVILDEDVVIDKHSKVHKILSINIYKKDDKIGASGLILTKYNYTIYSTDYPKDQNFHEKFSRCLNEAETINFIGIYNSGVPEKLNNISCSSHKKVKINIYYASDKLKDEITIFFNSQSGKLAFQKKHESINGIIDWYNNFSDKSNVEIKLWEYGTMLSFGASSVDIDTQGRGFIHVSNYIRNIIPDDTPYIEIEWKTRSKPPLYKFYYDYFQEYIFRSATLFKELGNDKA